MSFQPTQESKLLDNIYDAALEPSLWPEVARQIAIVVGSHQSIIIATGADLAFPNQVTSYGVNPEIHELYEEIIDEDLWLQGMTGLPAGTSCTGRQFISTPEFQKTRFYNELCKPADVLYMAGGIAINDANNFLCLGCQTSKSVGQLGRKSLRSIQSILGHIERSMFIHRRVAEVKSRNQELEETLDQSNFGVIFLNGSNQVLWCNKSARKILPRRDGISSTNGTLQCSGANSRNANLRIERHLLEPGFQGNTSTNQYISVCRRTSERPDLVSICPVTGKSLNSHHRASFVAFIFDPDNPPCISPTALRVFYGLTNAETKVCFHILQHRSVTEIADRLAVSKNTVKTQLKSIFQKCDVH